jgi:hypothetical protein
MGNGIVSKHSTFGVRLRVPELITIMSMSMMKETPEPTGLEPDR